MQSDLQSKLAKYSGRNARELGAFQQSYNFLGEDPSVQLPSRFDSKRLVDPGTTGVERGERFKLALKQAGT